MAILVLVLAVLTVSFASSLKAYLQQRHDIDALRSEISERQQAIDSLEAQKDRWKDPAYLEQQARSQLGYVMPGQTAYVALDKNGKPIQPSSSLSDPSTVGEQTESKAWWSTVWSSVELAGNPPTEGD
jgi:cell division protein FtsB